MSQDLSFAFTELTQLSRSNPRTRTDLRRAACVLASDLCRQAQEVITKRGLRPWSESGETKRWCIVPHTECTSPPVWSIVLEKGKFYLCHSDTTRYDNEFSADPTPLIAWISGLGSRERWIEAVLSSLRTYSP